MKRYYYGSLGKNGSHYLTKKDASTQMLQEQVQGKLGD